MTGDGAANLGRGERAFPAYGNAAQITAYNESKEYSLLRQHLL